MKYGLSLLLLLVSGSPALAQSCPGSGTISLNVVAAPSASIDQSGPLCTGGVTTLGSAGTYASYTWSTGATTPSIAVTAPGNYRLTVTTAAGCTASAVLNVGQQPAPQPVITTGSYVCGQSLPLSAGNFSAYTWSTGETSPSVAASTPGLYTVTVTNAQGCTGTASLPVNLPTPPAVDITNNGTPCAGSAYTLTAVSSVANYSWNTGSSESTITATVSGTYTVLVTDNFGCTATATETVQLQPVPMVSITGPASVCAGQPATLSATPGFASYNWSNGVTTASITTLIPGSYTVTVSNAAGCTATAVRTVSAISAPAAAITTEPYACDGQLTLTAPVGQGSYQWSTGATNAATSVGASGTYTVTVTNANGCSATASFTAALPVAPSVAISGGVPVCPGDTTSVSATPGLYSYAWSSGLTTAAIAVVAPGTYTVTATDANGCTATASLTLNPLAAPTAAITVLPYACDGQLTLTAPPGQSTYAWSNGATSAGITVTAAGTYALTVTSSDGCSATANYTALLSPPPVMTVAGNAVLCPGATLALTASLGLADYTWSNGETVPGITVGTPGDYTVTATDVQGCTATATVSVEGAVAPNAAIAGPSGICPTGTATFTVAGTFAAYTWSTGATTPSITATAAGTYTVTVTDTAGCTASASRQLAVNTTLEPEIVAQPYACDGAVALDAGAGFATYTWSVVGQTGAVLTVTIDGTYTVTVTDGGGCSGTAVFAVAIPAPPSVEINGATAICPGQTTALTATATAGVGYSWSSGEIGSWISVTAPGTYVVTVSDALGCTAAATTTVAALPTPTPVLPAPPALCAGATATLTVEGSFAGYAWSNAGMQASIVAGPGAYSVTVTSTDGCTGTVAVTIAEFPSPTPQIAMQPYSCSGVVELAALGTYPVYAWSTGSTTTTATATTSGVYALTVTDANGCTGVALLPVDVPALPVVSISAPPAFCPGTSATLAVAPGFVGYTWSGSGAVTGPMLTVTEPGTYTVTATDAAGCTATATVAIGILPAPLPTIAGPQSVCVGASATFSVPGNYAALLWNTGSAAAVVEVPAPATVTVTVTDENGCAGTASADVAISNQVALTPVVLPYQCDGQYQLDAGAGFTSYVWSNGATTPTTAVTAPGSYSVTVTAGAGCSGTGVLAVGSVPPAPAVTIDGDNLLCPGAQTTLSAPAGFAAYAWSTGSTAPTVTAAAAGLYALTVTDVFGCTATAVAAVQVAAGPMPQLVVPTPLCAGIPGTLSVANAADFAAITWSTGVSGSSLPITQTGTYGVTATDANGCTATAAAQVTIEPLPDPQVTLQQQLCTPEAVLSATPGYSAYTWSSGQNTASATVTISGTYTVTVTSAAGCTGTAAVPVTIQPPPLASVGGVPAICSGAATTLTAPGGFTAYQWSTGGNAPFTTVNTPGLYTVTVTDANNCTATAALQVQALPNPVVSLVLDGPLCGPGSTAMITAAGSAGTLAWSTGDYTNAITVTQPGTYAATLTDANGCTATAQLPVPANEPAAMTVQRESCRPEEAGVSTLYLTAANGCDSVVTTITTYVPTRPGLTLDVPDQLEGAVGQTLSFDVAANFAIDSVAYTTALALSCTDCLSPSLTATVPGFIRVTAFDAGGCGAVAELRVSVSTEVDVYVPNAFTPGSGDNGFFAVFSAPEIRFVRNFNVYDRWGNALFRRDEMPTNDPSAGWDGTFRGQNMQPGVYVWYFEVALPNGETRLLKGDVTIVK